MLARNLRLVGVALLGACTLYFDGPDDQPPETCRPSARIPCVEPEPEITARTVFEAHAHPVFVAKCMACHAADTPQGNISAFVARESSRSYDLIVGSQELVGDFTLSGAPIISKVTGPNPTPAHRVLAYSAEEIQGFGAWLELEQADREGP